MGLKVHICGKYSGKIFLEIKSDQNGIERNIGSK